MFILQVVGGAVEDPYSLPIPVPQPAEQRRSVQEEIRNHLTTGNGTLGNGTLGNGTPPPARQQLNTPDRFVSSIHNGNRDIASGENAVEGFITVGSVTRLVPRVAAYTGRGAGVLGIGSRVTPFLAPISGYLAFEDWRSDYQNYCGTTTDGNGDEIDNSLYDVRAHAQALRESGINITLTPEQERIRANQLRSRRARDFYINSACTSSGAIVGTILGAAAWGTVIGSFIPIPILGTAIGFVVGAAAGLCIGAGVGNLVGSAVKGICNFFGGLFGGTRRGGYS